MKEDKEQPLPPINLSSYTRKESLDITGLYEFFYHSGYNYGEKLQLIKGAWAEIDKFIFEVKLPEIKEGKETGNLWACLTDGIFQTVLAVQYIDKTEDTSLYLPHMIKTFHIYSTIQSPCFVVINRHDMKKRKDNILSTLSVYDEKGAGVARIENLLFSKTPESFNKQAEDSTHIPSETDNVTGNKNQFISYIKEELSEIISSKLEVKPEDISEEESFFELGVDSFTSQEIMEALESRYNSLPVTLLFEYPNINRLASFLVEKLPEERKTVLMQSGVLQSSETESGICSNPVNMNEPILHSPVKDKGEKEIYPHKDKSEVIDASESEDIAIIGLSGRFPLSEDINELWEHLKNGESCIREVPETRWDYRKYYDETGKRPDKSYTKYGGFLDDYDKFDAPFFHISPRQAELMDPQQRIVLETAWAVIEDAGYTRAALPRNTGVFIGVTTNTYGLCGLEASLKSEETYCPDTDNYDVPNRISYFFDLHGPSVAIDTACSSSLSAIHMAVKSLKNKESDVAIAGGVSLTLHPNRVIQFCQKNMLLPGKDCHPFGQGEGGFVDSEGVALILLKPLSKAIEDRDHIYGVIKGTAMNSGGKTSGYTVPDPARQASLVINALEDAKTNPVTISYIETHGTGTTLGDPIEVEGLTKAFRKYTDKTQYCPIGSIKSNIGHLIAAAGIAGVTKVLLQMKHKTLVPSIHSSSPNSHIDFSKTPFFVQQNLTEWKKPEIEGRPYPRRAGISSFGAGGANAHVIIDEYERDDSERKVSSKKEYIIVLSAGNKERLNVYIEKILKFLELNMTGDLTLDDQSYTLQTGREAMEERLALIVDNKNQLITKLTDYRKGKSGIEDLYSGNAKKDKNRSDLLLKGKAGEAFFEVIIKERDIATLARLWVSGIEIDWNLLYPDMKPSRISLPTYPFAKERYWIPESKSLEYPCAYGSTSYMPEKHLHPFISTNSSTLREQKFTTLFTGKEFYLSDHIVSGKKVLPGVAYIEMAKAAGELAGAGNIQSIKDIVWIQPVVVEESAQKVDITLYPVERRIEFEASITEESGERIVCSQGKLYPQIHHTNNRHPARRTIDIEAIKERCDKKKTPEECYEFFKNMEVEYGKGFQPIREIVYNAAEALSLLELPAHLMNSFDDFVLHPTLMDGALQTAASIIQGETDALLLPFSLGEIEIINPFVHECYAYAKQGKLKTFDIRILDLSGNLLVHIHDFSVRQASPLYRVKKSSEFLETLYFKPLWEKSGDRGQASGVRSQEVESEHVLIFDIDEDLYAKYVKELGYEKVILIKPGDNYQNADLKYTLNPEMRNDYSSLIASLYEEKNISPTRIVYLWSKADSSSDSGKNIFSFGFFPLLYLTQSLMSGKPKDTIRLLYVYREVEEENQKSDIPLHRAISGFAKTVRIENPKFTYTTLSIDNLYDSKGVLEKTRKEFELEEVAPEVRYQNDRRFIKRYKEFEIKKPTLDELPLKHNGTYLITGGAGRLGVIFAGYLANKFKANLVLTGRSDLTVEKESKIDQLRTTGAKVLYIRADVSKKEDVQRLIKEAKSAFTKIDGIIHGAGVIRDSFILKKTEEEAHAVLSPKIGGAIHLDEVLKDEELDFFVLFSSIAGAMGNMGQCDYAYANAFMDHFADYRQVLTKQNKRFGKTVSINWPVWKDGGMQVEEETIKLFRNTMGTEGLLTDSGLEAFEKGLSSDQNNFIVIYGAASKITKSFEHKTAQVVDNKTNDDAIDESHLLYSVQKGLSKIVSNILKVKESDIDMDADMSEYGFDSITLTEFVNQANELYGLELMPALFFEYTSIGAFAEYLCEGAKEKTRAYYKASIKKRSFNKGMNEKTVFSKVRPRFKSQEAVKHVSISEEPIAITGMSGVMPGSEDLDEFWRHLKNGDHLIRSIPKERWDWEEYYGDPLNGNHKTRIKWGGFIDDIDKFDASFFNISPHEAELMDPQQRILLETVWRSIEDAGYKASDLSGTKTGLFIGVSNMDYMNLLTMKTIPNEAHTPTGTAYSILVNRISWLLNLHGPSEPVDTACSSSLVAVHRAVMSIRNNECTTAIAGGVNALLLPELFISFDKAGMLSPDGRCKTFDQQANGYVRGEGVGVVLLKPLKKAKEDGDRIYAIIKGTAVNHGGRVSSLTVPNPNAQAALLIEAYEKADIDPWTVSYIEAHGTGTVLGDPVEINGLKKAFKTLYVQKGKRIEEAHCGLGSVKTNIGHLEAAAGIAGMIKVLLSMKNKTLPATIHLDKINPQIVLKESPFYIVDKTTEWKPVKDEHGREIRRAGVSSFGFGGSNAHVVLEEYENDRIKEYKSDDTSVVILSAKDEKRLKAYAQNMVEFLKTSDLPSLAEFSYTLQKGREAMEERLAVIVNNKEELISKLKDYIDHKRDIEDLYIGNVKYDKGKSQLLFEGEAGDAGDAFYEIMIKNKELSKLARLWISGAEIDWTLLYPDEKPNRISLPTYPFAKERHWIPGTGLSEHELSCDFTIISVKEKEERNSPFFYLPQWIQEPLNEVENEKGSARNILIIYHEKVSDLAKAIYAFHNVDKVSEIILGLETKADSGSNFKVDIRDAGAMDRCVKEIERPDLIYFLGGIEREVFHPHDMDALRKSQDMGVISLFRLIKSLTVHKISQKQDKIDIKIVTSKACQIIKDEMINPSGASLFGLSKSAAKEFSQLNICCIDIDINEFESDSDYLSGQIYAEPVNSMGEERVIRNRLRYVRKIYPVSMPDPGKNSLFRDHGVYLILGGAGGIGLELAKYLAERVQARLILLGRSEVKDHQKEQINRIEGKGGNVLYLKADATNLESMKEAVKEAKSHFGNINGVFHSAIVLKDKSLTLMDEETFKEALSVKIRGTMILHKVLQNEPLDFMMFFSSIQSFWGSAGQSNYASGCCFKDAFSLYLNQTVSYPVKTINWGYWGSVGVVSSEEYNEQITSSGILSIEPEEGMNAVERIVNNSLPQVIVLKAKDYNLLEKTGVDFDHLIKIYHHSIPSLIHKVTQDVKTRTH